MTTILLTGKTGQVGWELQRTLAPLGNLIALGRGEMDLTNPDSIRAAIRSARPDIMGNNAYGRYLTAVLRESRIATGESPHCLVACSGGAHSFIGH